MWRPRLHVIEPTQSRSFPHQAESTDPRTTPRRRVSHPVRRSETAIRSGGACVLLCRPAGASQTGMQQPIPSDRAVKTPRITTDGGLAEWLACPRGLGVKARLREKKRDLRRSNPHLRRLQRGVHPLRRGSGVLQAEGVRIRPQALSELPGGQAFPARCRRVRPGRRSAGILRRRLLALRQSGPGAVQAPHGPAGLLFRLLPSGSRPGRLRPSTWPTRHLAK
jgi:hypothetical protein